MEDTSYVNVHNKGLIVPVSIFAIGIIMMFFESLKSIGPFLIGAGLGMIMRRA